LAVTGKVVQDWQPDPFGLHEARYFSATGQPTKLVRDRGTESYDEPPSGADEVAAVMARISAPPAPPALPRAPRSRDAYTRRRPSGRDPRGRPSIVGIAASGIILAAAFLVAQTTVTPRHASPSGAGDAALVNQAATWTLQQGTADVVLSATTVSGGKDYLTNGTGAIDLDGKAGTISMTSGTQAGVLAFREIWVNDYLYIAQSINGRSISPQGKAWIAEPVPSPESGRSILGGGNPTAALASLEKQGLTVSALGTKVVVGVPCTGYTVTSSAAQATATVWIDPQHLVREISENGTADILSNGASATPAPSGAPSMDVTIDFSYSAAPVRVTAPPADSTTPYNVPLQ
jgi:hypothetical protein